MARCETRELHYPTVDYVLDMIARWIGKFGDNRDELNECSPEERRQIAKDLGLPVNDLRALIREASGAASAVSEMLRALFIDEPTLAKEEPAAMRDLQRTCMLCVRKGRCRHELAGFTAALNFHEFCPNAYTLDALLRRKEQRRRH